MSKLYRMPLKEVQMYGFRYGPADVIRIATIEGRGRFMEVVTDYQRIEVHISEHGRVITASRNGKYLR